MNDVSGNDEIIEDQEEITEETSDQDSIEEETSDQGEHDEEIQTVLLANDPIDYSNYFENLQTIGVFISGLLVAYGIAFAFFKGFKK